MRFIGITRQSSTIKSTLISIIKQIHEIFNEKLSVENSPFNNYLNDLDREVTESLKINELSSILNNLLNEIYIYCPEETIYFFIDAVDNLDEDELNNLSWFFSSLMPNTKFVYTGELKPTSADSVDLLEKFQKKLRKPDCYIELRPESKIKSFDLLNTLLTNQNRTITPEQTKIVKTLFDKVTTLLPLHITLLADITSKWKSSEVPNDEFKKCLTIQDCIRYIFKRLECVHGEKFVSRVLFYVNEFKKGINLQELADICTLDDDLLQHVFSNYLPPIIQFPMQMLKLFEHEIKNYYYYKSEDDVNLICWLHKSFLEVFKSNNLL